MKKRLILTALALVAMTAAADAHVGHGAQGLAHGFSHPFTGVDHIAAMVAVGLFAARLGGRALWLVPSAFVSMMLVGGILGMYGVAVPMVEAGIGLSVVVLGLAVAMGWRMPVALAMSMVGVFAVFHGFAHGAEMPNSASGASFAAGFIAATVILHAAGIALGIGLNRLAQGGRLAAAGGGALAVLGLGLLASNG